MSRIDLEQAAGMRNPTAEETGKIARYYQFLYKKRILLCKRLSTIFIVLGLLCLFGYTAGGWVSVVVGIVFFLLAFLMVRGKNEAKSLICIFEQGRFRVFSGSVYEISRNADFPDMHNVKFRADAGWETDSWSAVRSRDLRIGTPLLLVYVDRQTARHEIRQMFTPFMLTEEALTGTMI
ncbi:MAG: hypothetical protein LIO75_07720 [Lachnospiraceae bacterium]|nr:hypothetical protein [Lachnospiraceae bacterium]